MLKPVITGERTIAKAVERGARISFPALRGGEDAEARDNGRENNSEWWSGVSRETTRFSVKSH